MYTSTNNKNNINIDCIYVCTPIQLLFNYNIFDPIVLDAAHLAAAMLD